MQANLECPRLRPGLAAAPDRLNPQYIVLWDQLRVGKQQQRLTMPEFLWVQLFDGRRTLRDIQAESMRQLGGVLLPLDWIASLVDKLDRALFLDGPRFREYMAGPIREPSCIGCYEGDADALRRQLAGLFQDPRGPGMPAQTKPDGKLRAALLPHIDYHRGGVSFAWGFREVFEHADASLFVIIGTSHYGCKERYTLTRKNFKTPLGIVPTDQTYIDRLAEHYGDGLFDDELVHIPEHSVELEVVFLQYLYEGKRPFRIVPLVVGSFADCLAEPRTSPAERSDIGRMINALRRAESETPEPICYIISGDLAHIGPKFGDARPVDGTLLAHSREQDQAILRKTEADDPAGYFEVIAAENDRRRICGLPPTYTLLEAVRPGAGRVLHYDQYVHPEGYESVSFASVGFYQ